VSSTAVVMVKKVVVLHYRLDTFDVIDFQQPPLSECDGDEFVGDDPAETRRERIPSMPDI